MFEKTTIGEWVVIALSIIYAVIATFSKPINEGGSYIAGTFFGSFVGSLIILYIIYWIITKVFSNSNDWGIVVWIIAIVGIGIVITIILAVIAAFIFGMAGTSTTSSYTTEQTTYQTIAAPSSVSKTIVFNSMSNPGWVQYTNYKDQFSISKPSDWSVETVDKSEIMDKSESLYSQTTDEFVYIMTPNAKGFIMVYGADFSGTLYTIFDDKEKTQISNDFYDGIVEGISQGETDEVKFSSIQKDNSYYLINGNPARRVTVYSTVGGESLSGDWYVIAHGNKYYVLGYFAMTGSTQSDSSTASNIMHTFTAL